MFFIDDDKGEKENLLETIIPPTQRHLWLITE